MGFKNVSSKVPIPKPEKGKLNNIDEVERLKYEKVSYRQKGTSKPGILVKGNVINSYTKTTQPSVPWKFETQVFDNNHENKAFGSKSIRFFGMSSEDPGPGSYLNEDNFSLMGRTKQSHSKKGFGNGFISKVERFPSEIDYKAYFLPGPGSYTSTSLPSTRDESEIQSVTKNNANGSRAFKAPGREDHQNKNNIPGPGHYFAERGMKRSQSQATPNWVFKSGVEKLKAIQQKSDNPPVGHYDVNSDYLYSKSESTFNILKNTSNFRAPLNCKRVKVDLYDPFKQVDEERIKNPGPGTYEDSNSMIDMIKRKNFKVNRYKVTKNDPSIKVMKLKERPTVSTITPGPGTYIDPLDRNKYEVAPVSSSVFKSDSLRDIYNLEQHKGPGPAFYKIKNLQPQKSYNYNPKRKWL